MKLNRVKYANNNEIVKSGCKSVWTFASYVYINIYIYIVCVIKTHVFQLDTGTLLITVVSV